MAGVWKRDGTVAVTNGNKKVTGTGTTFADTKNGVAKGHLFCITSGTSVDFYEVDYVVSNTELYLVQAYRGVTATGKAYEIITTFSDSVPEFARRLTATLSAYQQQSDAFQALLTSTATTVEVTAPDGTKQTLIPWKRVTSEGEGQAARAKTEADKAAASAALAGDIVAASALPLPDVWAPLSDSLRLITGYGREVKVGDDVVARMVNFSRNSTATYIGKDGLLKTAAANEPRFELDGLLIEGQSTNYIPRSESYDSYAKTNLTVSGKVLTRSVTSGESFLGIGTFSLPTGKVTISAAYKKSSAVNFDTFNVYCERFTPKAAHLVKVKEVGDLVVVSATVDADFSAGSASVFFKLFTVGGVAGSVQLEYFQMEALPFASSHIPTNGAAATRAADYPSLPSLGNLAAIPATIAMTVNMLGEWAESTGSRRRLYTCGSAYTAAREGAATALFNYCGDTSRYISYKPTSVKKSRLVFRRGVGSQSLHQDGVVKISDGAVALFADTGPQFHIGCNGGAEQLFGHIRDLRIWLRELTDAQVKAIA
ncbi:phage head spike fiber domain-containing protein [Aeromonas veronii]|uniref:phage head spike fiber domain-containing protein n=1 Tax=Aeromonas veronii TaxID=654 RepID=UPI003BA2BBB0